MKKVGFYAPIKPPDHPIASGDRLIARNIVCALRLADFDVELASSFIAYSKRPDDDILSQRMESASAEAQKVIDRFASAPPDIFLTYHPYCKAPDWIGPRVSDAFGIPYATIEACRTGQGREHGQDLWHKWREQAQLGISQATRHFYFKPMDRDYLQTFLPNSSGGELRSLAPFIDSSRPESLPAVDLPDTFSRCPTLITVAQMRGGKKFDNYQILAKALESVALEPLHSLDWNLIIVGDGPHHCDIRSVFSAIDGERLHWAGSVDESQVLSYMSVSDIFVWPGWHEPIGMVYLEAQKMGLPIVAQDSFGVSLVVEHNETGLLVPEASLDEDQIPLGDAITRLLTDTRLRKKLGDRGVERIETHHSLRSASLFFQSELNDLVH